MDASPKGREIRTLDGDAGTIVARGNKITELGEQMISSAALLKSIADGASGQKGLAVDTLQEVVGDCYSELKLAGERYKPSGPVLVAYGQVVSEVQPLIRTAVTACEAEWQTVTSRRSAVWSAESSFYPPPAEDASADAKTPFELRQEAVADAQSDADAAYDDWVTEARVFDTHYDTWETAFETAAAELTDATDGGIKDSKWDDLDGFVAGALEVLTWVGMALAVLGVIIGGPFIAALAAIVAIATLLLTLYSFSRGNSTWGDLAWAIVGVIPFGNLSKLKGDKLGFLDDMAGGLTSKKGLLDIGGDLGHIGRGAREGWRQGANWGSSLFKGGWGGVSGLARANGTGANVISRLFTGRPLSDFDEISRMRIEDQGFGVGLDIIAGSWGNGFVKNMFGIPNAPLDLVNNWFPSEGLSEPLWGTPTR